MEFKKILVAVCLTTLLAGGMILGHNTVSAAEPSGKKAILVTSFGTTYAETRALTTDAVEAKIKQAFPDYEVRRAFTSRIIIKKLAERDGIQIDTEKQALEKLKAEGFSEVIVQPLHMEAGDEFEKLSKVVEKYEANNSFKRIVVGRPLLYFTGQEERPDDYSILIAALKTQLPKLGSHDVVAFMGHGGVNPSNAAYGALQLKFQDEEMNNVLVFTVEGYPTIENVINKCKAQNVKKVVLMPLMLVAGDHANEDMAGADKDSFKSQLQAAGFQVETYIHGLGENLAVQDLYVQHVKDAIENKYNKKERGKDRPQIPVID